MKIKTKELPSILEEREIHGKKVAVKVYPTEQAKGHDKTLGDANAISRKRFGLKSGCKSLSAKPSKRGLFQVLRNFFSSITNQT